MAPQKCVGENEKINWNDGYDPYQAGINMGMSEVKYLGSLCWSYI